MDESRRGVPSDDGSQSRNPASDDQRRSPGRPRLTLCGLAPAASIRQELIVTKPSVKLP